VGPNYAETDISVTKTTRINERMSLQLKGEIFNIVNHPNFAPPAGSIINAGSSCGPTTLFNATNPSSSPCFAPTGAAITSLVGSGGIPDVARQTQFSAKLTF
jgi:hypothetical protein